jgi:Tol biopolymer transport system component
MRRAIAWVLITVVFVMTLLLSLGAGSVAGAKHPRSHIYSVSVEGAARRQLTNADADDLKPAVSPDGRWVAFLRIVPVLADHGAHVWVMRSDGSEERILSHTGAADGPLAWSPNGRVLLFSAWDYSRCVGPNATKCAFTDVWAVDVATGVSRLLLPHAQNPRWSPDGRTIVYQDFWPGIATSRVLLAAASGAMRRVLAKAGLSEAGSAPPTWSPSGHAIVFGAGIRQRLFVVGRSGGRPRRLTQGMKPAWSPDGRELAVARFDGIWAVATRARTARRLARDRFFGGPPTLAWSPSGSELAYLDERELVVVRRRDRRVRTVARPTMRCCIGGTNPRAGAQPAWSRDGRRLFYAG